MTTQYDISTRDNGSTRLRLITPEPTRAKQSFKTECDINHIVNMYKKKGVITHLNPAEPRYGFAPSIDLQTALTITAESIQAFESMPAEVRNRFSNDPVKFVAFLEDPDNEAELRKMRLLPPKSPADGTQETGTGSEAPLATTTDEPAP